VPLRRSAHSLLGAAFYLLCAAGCLWLLAGGAHGVIQARQALDWPKVAGVVESSEVMTGCGRGGSHYARVLYSYEVAGAKLQGSRLAFGNVGCGSWSAAASIARTYKVGQAVRVHWNPKQPGDSALVVGEVPSDTWLGIALSLGMLVASLWLLHYYLRGKGAA